MTLDFRWLLTLAGNLVFLFILTLINDSLSSLSLALYACAPMILFPAKIYTFPVGLVTVIASGVAADAFLLLPQGTSPIPFAILFTAYYTFRFTYKAYSKWHNTLCLLVINAVLSLYNSLSISPQQYLSKEFWLSITLTILLSQTLLLIVSPWYLAFHKSIIKYITNPHSGKPTPEKS